MEAVCELQAVVRLDAFNGIGEALDTVLYEFRRRVGVVLLERFKVTEAAVFIDEGILVVVAAILFGILNSSADQAGAGDEFDVDLDLLTRIIRLFVRFGDILWVRQLHGHLASLSQKAIQTGYGSAVSSLPELDPEHHQACVWVPAPHVVDQLDFLWLVLIRVTVWPVRTIFKRFQRAVIAFHPAVDVLPVCPVPFRCFCDAMFLGVEN